jgi:hypothetical protein
MADVKVTGLSAITPPLDNGSLFLTSSYDGVSAYTSEKLTLTQLRDEVFLMESEDKLTFDSSGTNKTVISDSSSDAEIQFYNGAGTYDIYIGDNGLADNYIEVSKTFTDLYSPTGGMTIDSGAAKEVSIYGVNGSQFDYFTGADNTSGNQTSRNVDVRATFIGTRNSTVNSGIYNAPIIGGTSITADKSNYMFSGKHELQLATEDFSFEDAGSVSATEQDWIEVSVGGVTGYIRVFATK